MSWQEVSFLGETWVEFIQIYDYSDQQRRDQLNRMHTLISEPIEKLLNLSELSVSCSARPLFQSSVFQIIDTLELKEQFVPR